MGRIVARGGRIAIHCNHSFRCPYLMRTMNANILQLDLPHVEDRRGFRITLLAVVAYVVLWVVVCATFALLWYSHDTLRGQVWNIRDYVRWATVEWTTVFALGPIALLLAARKPIEPPHRLRRFVFHLFASIAFALLAVIMATAISVAVDPGRPDLREQLNEFVTKHGEAGFLAYWVLAMTTQTLFFYREKSYRELQASRLQAQLAQSRLQLLKMQLHPHFLFNTLHAAATLTREDAVAAEDMLLRLSELLRTYLADERQEISLREELDLIDLYLGIQRVRFNDRLTTRIDVDPELLDCAVPSLILQPIVENAISHGIGKQVGADCVEIECYRMAENLYIDVRNRNSTLAAASEKLFQRGIGLSNTRLRLNELYGSGGQISLGELKPRGVICRIGLPLKLIVAGAPRVGRTA